jgi:hypothetical protein
VSSATNERSTSPAAHLAYLRRELAIERTDHVWCADATYIPARKGFLHLDRGNDRRDPINLQLQTIPFETIAHGSREKRIASRANSAGTSSKHFTMSQQRNIGTGE